MQRYQRVRETDVVACTRLTQGKALHEDICFAAGEAVRHRHRGSHLCLAQGTEARCLRFEYGQGNGAVHFDEESVRAVADHERPVDAAAGHGLDVLHSEPPSECPTRSIVDRGQNSRRKRQPHPAILASA